MTISKTILCQEKEVIMKKTGLLLTLVVALFFSSCSSKNPISSGKSNTDSILTLSVWTYYSGAAKNIFYDLVDEFNETVGKENNIIIDPRTTGNVGKLASSILASANEDIGAEPIPHIFMGYPDSAYKIDQMDMVLDLDPYFSEDELSEYRSDFLDDGRFGSDNALKIIPIAKSSEIIYVNKTDFDLFASEVTVDLDSFETWEGLAEISEQYYNWTDSKTSTPYDGKAFFGIDSMANYILIGAEQLNNSVFNVSTDGVEITLTRETAKKLWDSFYPPFVSGHFGNIGNFRSDDASTGDILAYTGSTAGASWFPSTIETGKDSSYPIESMTFPFPTFEGGDLVTVHQGAGMVVTKSDDAHQDAAVLFLKWFTDATQNSKFAIQTGYIPVKTELLNTKAHEFYLAENPDDVISDVVAMSNETAYSMIESYSMYANKPYSTSFETRQILEKSMITFAKNDLVKINEEIKTDTKENVLANYITEENFENWYLTFMTELENQLPN